MKERELANRDRSAVQRFVDRVALLYGAQSLLEGPVDGAGRDRGLHGLLAARRGVRVTVALPTAEDEERVRAGYAGGGLPAPETRRVLNPLEDSLPAADMVVSFDAPPYVHDWQRYIAHLAGTAGKVLVVVVRNPQRLQFAGVRAHPGRETLVLAPVLWAAGRVREHAYLGVPRVVSFLANARRKRAPVDVVQGPVGAGVRRTAALHAFVVDTAPRTPQARRRLRTVRDASA
jgi:hypothetical protein